MTPMTNPFLGWLAEVASDPVVVCPDDILVEAQRNLWTFGLGADQQAAVAPAEVEEFVRAVVAARGRWLASCGAGPMRFYCWHDGQAGQLRFSLVSVSPARLPFGCPVEPVSTLGTVVRAFLGLAATETHALLPVWVTILP